MLHVTKFCSFLNNFFIFLKFYLRYAKTMMIFFLQKKVNSSFKLAQPRYGINLFSEFDFFNIQTYGFIYLFLITASARKLEFWWTFYFYVNNGFIVIRYLKVNSKSFYFHLKCMKN